MNKSRRSLRLRFRYVFMEMARATGIWANLLLKHTKQASGVERGLFWSQERFVVVGIVRFHNKGLLQRAPDPAPGQTEARNGRFHIKGLLGKAIEPFPGQSGARNSRFHNKGLSQGATDPAPG